MFLLGSDPELLLKRKQDNSVISAIEIVEEGKGFGRPLKSGAGSVLHDNVLVEVNTNPAETKEEFVTILKNVLADSAKIVDQHGAYLSIQASAEYPDSELEHPEARIFGCDPDYDAWTVDLNQVPPEAPYENFRSAGGHLHIGMGKKNKKLDEILDAPYGKLEVVKALDVFCALPAVFLDKDPTAPARRALYGRAGAHRPKEYGVEYRALGNWWLGSPVTTKLIYELTEAALNTVIDRKCEEVVNKLGKENIINTINNSDVKTAKKMYSAVVKKYLSQETQKLCATVERKTTTNLYKEWSL